LLLYQDFRNLVIQLVEWFDLCSSGFQFRHKLGGVILGDLVVIYAHCRSQAKIEKMHYFELQLDIVTKRLIVESIVREQMVPLRGGYHGRELRAKLSDMCIDQFFRRLECVWHLLADEFTLYDTIEHSATVAI